MRLATVRPTDFVASFAPITYGTSMLRTPAGSFNPAPLLRRPLDTRGRWKLRPQIGRLWAVASIGREALVGQQWQVDGRRHRGRMLDLVCAGQSQRLWCRRIA